MPFAASLCVRLRLPPADGRITVETIHSAFKVTRERDAQYNPPGRLRQYDLIILDEVSQIDANVWQQVSTACSELSPCPFVVFVGDFQQLQPIDGDDLLQRGLQEEEAAGGLCRIELQQHNAARSTDPDMLSFLAHARVHQPSRRTLEDFFAGRKLSRNLNRAAAEALRIERETGKSFTFLSVTNKGAEDLNLARLRLEYPDAAAKIDALDGIRGDPNSSVSLVLQEGMRVRLTRNLDKDRGFVNGNIGVVERMLTKEVFILRTMQGNLLLVHPITEKGETFAPRLHAQYLCLLADL